MTLQDFFWPVLGLQAGMLKPRHSKAKLLITLKAGFVTCLPLLSVADNAPVRYLSLLLVLTQGMESRRAFIILMSLVRLPKLHILHGEETLRL